MSYDFGIERLADTYDEFEPLYRQHYAEMQARLARDGFHIADYAPRLDAYFAANDRGDLIHFTVRKDGKPVGYSNIYVLRSMHNGQLIAREDTIYVHPDHRNGVGYRLAKRIIAALRQNGVERFDITAMTDDRAIRLWERLGFRKVAPQMALFLQE